VTLILAVATLAVLSFLAGSCRRAYLEADAALCDCLRPHDDGGLIAAPPSLIVIEGGRQAEPPPRRKGALTSIGA